MYFVLFTFMYDIDVHKGQQNKIHGYIYVGYPCILFILFM